MRCVFVEKQTQYLRTRNSTILNAFMQKLHENGANAVWVRLEDGTFQIYLKEIQPAMWVHFVHTKSPSLVNDIVQKWHDRGYEARWSRLEDGNYQIDVLVPTGSDSMSLHSE